MPRVSIEAFSDKQVEPVYVAATLREARRVEEVLTRQGIEYAVEVEPFVRYLFLLIPRVHAGATFYVLSDQRVFCRKALESAGLRVGLTSVEG
jgi:hypothetical protein